METPAGIGGAVELSETEKVLPGQNERPRSARPRVSPLITLPIIKKDGQSYLAFFLGCATIFLLSAATDKVFWVAGSSRAFDLSC